MANGSYRSARSGSCRRVARRASKPGNGVPAEVAQVIAALLEDHEATTEACDSPTHLLITGRREREVADRVLLVRVEPEGDHDDVARRGRDPVERTIEI